MPSLVVGKATPGGVGDWNPPGSAGRDLGTSSKTASPARIQSSLVRSFEASKTMISGLLLFQGLHISRWLAASNVNRVRAIDRTHLQGIVFLRSEIARRAVPLRKRHLEARCLFVVPRSRNVGVEGLRSTSSGDG